MHELVPEIPEDRIFLVGDLRADAFLSNLPEPRTGTLGVFSGWREPSFIPSAGLRAPALLEHWMESLGFERAVLTVHPRVRSLPDWPVIESALLELEAVEFAPANEWERAFAHCEAYLGDDSTSLHDTLRLTGRPVHTVRHLSEDHVVETQAGSTSHVEPGWTVGTAPRVTVDRIRSVMQGEFHG